MVDGIDPAEEDKVSVIGNYFREGSLQNLKPGEFGMILGTLAAFVLTRIPRFKGRTLFGGMVTAPLVMPEVIIGLSLLLMLVSVQRMFGFPERGMGTILLGVVIAIAASFLIHTGQEVVATGTAATCCHHYTVGKGSTAYANI